MYFYMNIPINVVTLPKFLFGLGITSKQHNISSKYKVAG